ncbi:MAG TPA: hypothetical protein VK087_00185 [Tissierellaceae bacterium]|nr:hypothetical protein [Tissierellaceae bacterium]
MVLYFRKILFGHPFIATITGSITRQTINIPVYSLIMVMLIPRAKVLGMLKKTLDYI